MGIRRGDCLRVNPSRSSRNDIGKQVVSPRLPL